MESSDSELVAQARQGDKQAFGELVQRHRRVAARLAVRLVEEECARDLVQEGVLQAYLSLDRLRDGEVFGSWLCGIVLNLCRSYRRGRKAESRSREDLAGGVFREGVMWLRPEPTAEEQVEAQELHQRVLRAIGELSPGIRQAVWLFYFEQLSVRELAILLGCSTGAVKSRLFKARGELREKLRGLWPSDEPSGKGERA